MPALIRWFVDNPVAANLLMLMLIVGGIISFFSIHREEFPNLATDTVVITVPYPGASPAEVEESVCMRLEEAVKGTPGVKTILVVAREGFCETHVELEIGVDNSRVVDDIKSRVDAVDSFPVNIEKPQVRQRYVMVQVLQIILSANADERSLKEMAYRLRDDIVSLPGVSQVNVEYVRPYEISIEVSEQALRRHDLTLAAVSDAIRSNSIDLPGGLVRTRSGEILLRTKAQASNAREIENIVVLTRKDGSIVLLGDIADVIDGFEEIDLKVRFNGKPAVMIDVKRSGQEDVIKLAERVKHYLRTIEGDLPEGMELMLWNDESADLVDRLAMLRTNALSGLMLVLLVLSLFLKPQLAIWVVSGIAAALLGSLMLFSFAGIGISTLSVIAFILVLGLLVDDAIVVAEHIYARQQRGILPREAAIEGTREVSVPVICGVLTTMVAFAPLLFIPATIGQWFEVFGLVVILALAFSIVESQLILPAHLRHRLVDHREPWLSKQLSVFAKRFYRPLLHLILHWRYLAVCIALALLLGVISLLASNRLIFQFFPPIAGERIYAALTMPAGTDIEAMEAQVQHIESAARQLQSELDFDLKPGESSRIQRIVSSIGAKITRGAISGDGDSALSTHFAEIALEISDPENYGLDPNQIAARWRELSGEIPGSVSVNFTAAAFSLGKAIDIQLRGDDLEELNAAAAKLKNHLIAYPGVFDIADTFRAGKLELQLQVRPEAHTLGLTTEDLAHQVRAAFYGLEVQRIQRGVEDVRVMLRFPESERRSLGDLEKMAIRTRDGSEVPFNSVALVDEGRGYSSIRRVDGRRVVNVQADVDRNIVSPEKVINSLQQSYSSELQIDFPNIEYSLAGEAEGRGESVAALIRNVIVALIVMYSLMAIPLKSYLQPLIIMSVIPFGLIGAIMGHYLLAVDFTIFSLLGIVAMGGVVVNSSLVLVDSINRRQRKGVNLRDAVVEAGQERFRPIVLTGLTTFVCLIPLMTNYSLTTFMFVPLAISLGFGVLVATVTTLLLVPAMYLILKDGKALINTWDTQSAGQSR